MGTWGYNPLDNDAALDVQHMWEHYVEPGRKEYGWDEEGIVRYFVERRWGDAVNCGDNITNSEIIAVVEIFQEESLSVPTSLRRIAQDAINRELDEGELSAWEDPDRRKASLLELLDSIGGRVKKPKRVRKFADPTVTYANRAVAERELGKLLGSWRKLGFHFAMHNDPDLAASLPSFLKTLHRFVHHGTYEKDSNITVEAVSQRLMMIAYYLGMSVGYDDEKIRGLIRDAKWEPPANEKG